MEARKARTLVAITVTAIIALGALGLAAMQPSGWSLLRVVYYAAGVLFATLAGWLIAQVVRP